MSTPGAAAAAANDYLAKQNPHPRDAHIHFDEGPHKYTIDGINGVTADTEFTSVTTFIHQHFEHFDAKKVIAGMMHNQKKWNDPVANAKYYGKTAEEIEQMWADAGKDASTKGTAMHHKIECFYNTPPALADPHQAITAATAAGVPDSLACDPSSDHQSSVAATLRSHRSAKAEQDTAVGGRNPHQSNEVPPLGGGTPPEFEYFLNFNKEHVAGEGATLRPYRTEWTVFHEEAQIAGSIDMVYEVIEHPVSNGCDLSPDHQLPHQSSVAATLSSHRSAKAEQDTAVGGRNPHHEEAQIAGSIDMVYEVIESASTAASTPLAIYDWKRCREIIKTNRTGKFATHPAIEHLPDTNFWHYALQLNTYKYILQTKYDKTITDLYLIVLHPDAQNYQRVKLPDLQTEVAELFEERIRQNKKQ
jgi:hypothetical protein